MPDRARTLAYTFAALAVLPAAAVAQGLPVGATVTQASVSGIANLDTDLDRGGDFSAAGIFAGVSVTRQFTPELTAGVRLRYDFEDWSFSGGNAFGAAPWDQLHRPSIAATFVYATPAGTSFTVIPSVQWAFESGASTGDALNWGAIVAVGHRYSKYLTLGLGAGIFREIDETKAFPVLFVDWRISDRLRLTNPYQGGPAGGAGLELTWTVDDRWEIAAGGTWRSFRFRLDRDGPYPDGIGEHEQVPLFVRAGWRPTPTSRLDFHAGLAVAGKFTVYDRDNRELVSDDHDPAPLLGLTFQSRF